ncbi:MAG: 5-amino-6-(D-ribitylamino)uracil--L-tyrosine 4-hydroxyphenyl transferase CofH [Methanosarcinales archaeon]
MIEMIHRTLSNQIFEKILNGTLNKEDALKLIDMNAFELFALANKLTESVKGKIVTYVINRNINFTNKCIGNCKFCAFRSVSDKSYFLSRKEILNKIQKARAIGATEVCIQGGLHPDMELKDYCDILESIKTEIPEMHTHAFSPMEVYHMAHQSGVSIASALKALKKSGLDSMPGTAAEILVDRIRAEICPNKLSTDEWIKVIKTAHKLKIPTTATIMYGHIENWEDRIEHILIIRDIQKETKGFTEFVPLPFMPHNNPLGIGLYGPTGIEDLKLHSIARIILYKHIDNIQASWVKLGKKLAQIALHCGANDLGGTLMEENISKSAGAKSGEYMSTSEFEFIIRKAGRVPRIRNTLYVSIPSIP